MKFKDIQTKMGLGVGVGCWDWFGECGGGKKEVNVTDKQTRVFSGNKVDHQVP